MWSKHSNNKYLSIHPTPKSNINFNNTSKLGCWPLFFSIALIASTQKLNATATELITTKPPNAPAGYQNTPEFKAGLLNVVAYGATPDNPNDNDGPKIQSALDDAYAYHLVCYFPSGTYHVNNQIECVHNADNRRTTYMFLGEKGTRPVIKLKSGANGYEQSSPPKSLLYIWTLGTNGGVNANRNFNNVIKGIDFDLGGNPKATGIEFAGAQGCSIEDVRIDATGAYSGFERSVGANGGYYNIEVEGGKYAIFIDSLAGNNDYFPIFAGCRFFNQTDRVLYHTGRSPITFVGFHIKKSSGYVFETLDTYHEAGGNLTLMDGVIEITGTGNSDIAIRNKFGGSKGKNVYLKDVYIYGAEDIIQEPDNNRITGTSGGWTEVKEYGWAISGETGNKKNGRHLINGSVSSHQMPSHLVNTNFTGTVPTGDTVVGRHVWDEASFPAFSDNDIFDAVVDGGIDNTGSNNVSNALNNILAAHDKVFLPKGIYKVGSTIHIPGNTKLFGIAKTFSILRPRSAWAPANEQYIIETEDDPDLSPLLAWVWLDFSHKDGNMVSPIHWRAGRGSMIRNIFAYDGSWDQGPNDTFNGAWGLNKKIFHFSGGGGGRIYGLCTEWQLTSMSSTHPDFRVHYANETTEPLHFYGLNVERQVSTYQSEFYKAKNIGVFGAKTEGDNPQLAGDDKPMLGLTECDNIIVGTIGGNTGGNGWVRAINSTNVLCVNILSQDHENLPLIKETFGNDTHTISANNYELAVFKRGSATLQHFDSSPPPSIGHNLIQNPSFETNDFSNWTMDATTQSAATIKTGFNEPDGTHHARLLSNGNYLSLEQSVPVVAGEPYAISGYVRLNPYFTGGSGAQVRLTFYDESETSLWDFSVTGNMLPPNPAPDIWSPFQRNLYAPSNATSLNVQLVVNHATLASARFDQISVVQLPPPSLALDPSFEDFDPQDTFCSFWEMDTFTQQQVSVSTLDPYDGTQNIEIAPTSDFLYIEQWIPVSAGTNYNITGHVKLTNDLQGGSGAYINVWFFESDKSTSVGSGTKVTGSNLYGTLPWTPYSTNLQAPTNAAFMRVRLICFGANTNPNARASFDQVIVKAE